MNRSTRAVLVAMVVALGAGFTSPPATAAAQQYLLRTPLTQGVGQQLTALRVTYAPGQSTPAHRHEGDAFVYVLSGHIRSQLEGGTLRTFHAGEHWFEPAGTPHLVCGNASTHAPASMLVIFVAAPAPQSVHSR
jgi:quercetin dioxygenase-like cupin family protein